MRCMKETPPSGSSFEACASAGWKTTRTGRSHLFYTCTDPMERHEHAPEFPDRIAAYRDRVNAWAAAQRHAMEP